MRKIKPFLQQILLCCAVIWVWKIVQGDASGRWDRAYELSSQAVVEVQVDVPSLGREATAGTGFLLRHGGGDLIVTNEHVIHGAEGLRLRFRDSLETAAEVWDASPEYDVAVLRVRGVDLERYGPLKEGQSKDLRIGDEVMTIGHPLSESYHLSIGLYSGRETIEKGVMLRLNMPVDPGNSGGPLLDARGRVVGITTLKATRSSSLAFAVPIERIRNLRLLD
jgi:serine protease Do